jgi:hypothetical protein
MLGYRCHARRQPFFVNALPLQAAGVLLAAPPPAAAALGLLPACLELCMVLRWGPQGVDAQLLLPVFENKVSN